MLTGLAFCHRKGCDRIDERMIAIEKSSSDRTVVANSVEDETNCLEHRLPCNLPVESLKLPAVDGVGFVSWRKLERMVSRTSGQGQVTWSSCTMLPGDQDVRLVKIPDWRSASSSASVQALDQRANQAAAARNPTKPVIPRTEADPRRFRSCSARGTYRGQGNDKEQADINTLNSGDAYGIFHVVICPRRKSQIESGHIIASALTAVAA